MFLRMIRVSVWLCLVIGSVGCRAQQAKQNIAPEQLQKVLDLPLREAVQQRMAFKEPLKLAYSHQMSLAGKDCESEAAKGQQPYNVCMGTADEQADKDYAVFYSSLQMLCHDQEELSALQSSETRWVAYRQSALEATHAVWPHGTGAPGFAGEVYLFLVRDRMRELHEIFGLNIAQ